MAKKIEYPKSALNDLVGWHGTGAVAKHFDVTTNTIRTYLKKGHSDFNWLQSFGTIKDSPISKAELINDLKQSKFKPKNKWPKDVNGIKRK